MRGSGRRREYLVRGTREKRLTAELLFRNDFHLYAPEFIFEEFEVHKEILQNKTERSYQEVNTFLRILQRRIILVPREEIDPFIDKAKIISPDIKDITYIALALQMNCAVWSNDKALKEKQKEVRVYSTHDLVQL